MGSSEHGLFSFIFIFWSDELTYVAVLPPSFVDLFSMHGAQ